LSSQLIIIGGGLAGCEAAWQAATRKQSVRIYEMKPVKFSPAHSSESLAELVCSNSLRSSDPASAIGVLKEELRHAGSLIMEAALATKVPAGKALAVNRDNFADFITEKINSNPLIEVVREELTEIPEIDNGAVILATGPLTSSGMADSLAKLTGKEHLSFFDAIAPIIAADSLDQTIVYQASRYDDGPGDYLNCPMDSDQYNRFITELGNAEKVKFKEFEGVDGFKAKYFEGCLPIEIMVERGPQTLRFGPMKPVGLPDPRSGENPFAVVQLRKEDLNGEFYNLVGFQTKLTYKEQKRIFRMIPGMENAQFARLGSVHRNTFVCGPEVLTPSLELKNRPGLFLAGQISGVEGYLESTAMGLLAGVNAVSLIQSQATTPPPPDCALGALVRHLTQTAAKKFQPSNVNFGLFPQLKKKIPKRLRGQHRAEIAQQSFEKWWKDQL
jgi:methylenetetrahydrofolate--tRNA-(uracil-5-)-methyltransferase